MSEVIEEKTLAEAAPEEVKPQTIDDLKPKMKLTGTVARLELYGAFIDLGVGTNALIHISQLGQEPVNRVSDVLAVGDQVTVWVDKVDPERKQIMVTMIEPLAVEWRDLKRGNVYTGVISRLEDYGVFVNIGAEREGLVHISELSHEYVKHPSEVVSIGDEVEVQVLNFSKRKRRIDLSMKALMEKPENDNYYAASKEVYEYIEDDEDEGEIPTAMELALRQALGSNMPVSRSKKSSKKRRRRKKQRSQQEEILYRTLQVQQN